MLETTNRRISRPIIFSAFVKPVTEGNQQTNQIGLKNQNAKPKLDLLRPLRKWLDSRTIDNHKLATFLAKVIPAQCPFERDIFLFGRKVVHIPPMCKLNPLYDELVGLRFRALCYLADVCGEDIQSYC